MSKMDRIHEEMTRGMECRNQECRNGYTPGIVTAGKGTANAPILGATMRWGWVKCRACNPDKDHPYDHRSRAPGEVAERARLADAKAPYDQKAAAQRADLERIRASTPAPMPTNVAVPGVVEKLLDQVTKLTDQVTGLLEENRKLRSRLEGGSNGSLPEEAPRRPARKKSVKLKEDETPPLSSGKIKRALS